MTLEEIRLEMRKDLDAMSKSRERLRGCEKETWRGNWEPYRKLLFEQYESMLEDGFYGAALDRLVEAVFVAACIEAVNNYLESQKAGEDSAKTYADAVAAIMDPGEIGRNFAQLRDALQLSDEMLAWWIEKDLRFDAPPGAIGFEYVASWIFHLARGETEDAEWELHCAEEKRLKGVFADDYLQAATRRIRRGHVRSGRI